MKVLRVVATAAVFLACGSLKEALPESPGASADAGPSAPARDAGKLGGDDDDDDLSRPDGATADGGACNGPCEPEILATGWGADALAVDQENVYFANNIATLSDSTVNACPKTGCGTAPALELGPGHAAGLAVFGGNVYWGDQSSGEIRRCAASGCGLAPTAIATGETDVRGVWTDGLRLVWTTSKDGGSIRYCQAAACVATTAVAGLGATVAAVVADQGRVYWSNGAKTFGCALEGCTPSPLGPASKQSAIYGLRLFSISGSSITDCSTYGCNQSPGILATSPSPAALAVDGTYLFWRDALDGAIYRCSSSGCGATPTVLATGQKDSVSNPAMTTDGLYVYWGNGAQVLRVRKTN